MKWSILFLVILNSISLFGQRENDTKEIVNLIIDKYDKDSIKVYYRFQNKEFIREIKKIKSIVENKLLKEKDQNSKEKLLEIYDKEENIKIAGIKYQYKSLKKSLQRKNRKRVKKYKKGKFRRIKMKLPIAFISTPIISKDKKSAIVYCSHICGGRCGKGGFQVFEKKNGIWEMTEYDVRWIS